FSGIGYCSEETAKTAPAEKKANSIKAADREMIAFQLSKEDTHFSLGLGFTTDLIGGVVKNGLGEPKTSFAFNTVAGFSYTTFFGSNSVDDIFNYTRTADLSSDLKDLYAAKEEIRKKIKKYTFSYFRIGTAYLFLPLVLQGGYCYTPIDNVRLEVGFGLPLVLSLGFNIDF
ncbi:hypothetical protein ACFL52_04940, partial [Candidatus Margulisiibacteriota bacterium]